ncbi:MAG: glycosyl hydrolase 53 family protein [Lachnospiraceae bacterium]|nr:glycosyl hydrolase 53 family protein [Lachnospiraceae bacterium]
MRVKRLYRGIMAMFIAVILAVITPGSTFLGGFDEVKAADETWTDTELVKNGDFSSGNSNWEVTIDSTDTKHGYEFKDGIFDVFDDDGVNMTFSLTQNIESVPAGTYRLTYKYFSYEWDDNGIDVSVASSSYTIPKGTGWGNWVTVSDDNTFTLDEAGAITISVSGTTCKWIKFGIDDIVLEKKSDSGSSGDPTDPDDPVTFRLYYYYDGTDTPLYIDIWKHKGLEFGDGAVTSDEFEWKVDNTDTENKKQATLTQDDTDENWYYTEFEIVDKTNEDDGFDVYIKNKSGWKEGYEFSSDVYTTLISGESEEYYLKDGTLTTEKPADNTPEETKTVKVYYYYTGSNAPLYMGVWDSQTTVKAGTDAEAEDPFNWGKNLTKLEQDTPESNWYYFSLIISDTENDNAGLGIYDSSGTSIASYGFKWEDTTTYDAIASTDDEGEIYIIGSKTYTTLATAKEYLASLNARTFDFDTTPVSASPVESDIYVDKVEIMNDFITGFDVSSYLSIRNSGATFKDFDGNVLTDQGFFDLLAENGVNYIRIRTWVDPFDADGNSYGGGACDLATAVKIGQWASNAGMRVLVDFHYSDFWTDPGKYSAPKAWQSMTLDDKAAALQEYTENSLKTMLDAGVDVGMVQVGNETTNGFCGENDWEKMCVLFNAGSQGIQNIEETYNRKIMIAIHFTNPESSKFDKFASNLDYYNVVYDVFATSYYPYWHGTLSNLTSKLSNVAETYNKYVMVAETSYARTYDDGDGHTNTVYEGKASNAIPYPVSLQSQALSVRNVVEAVANVPNNKGIGVFYWEPAWIPVQVYDADASNAATVLAQNKALWEKYGSGWASSYSAGYDEDAGKWYGGSAVDNEAVFDFDGTALDTLKVFNMIRGGTTSSDSVIGVLDTEAEYELDDDTTYEDIELPETVDVMYASGKTEAADVTWSEKDIKEAVYSGAGEYPIAGTVEFDGESYDVTCVLTLLPKNYLINPSFEDSDTSMWIKEGTEASSISRKSDGGNYRTGSYAFHFWDEKDMTFTFYQTVTVDAGIYTAGCFLEGGDGGNDYTIEFFVKTGDNEETEEAILYGWLEWQNPEISGIEIEEDGTEITVGVRVTGLVSGAWGAFDDFYLNRVPEDVEYHIIEGANSEWTEEEGGNITIKSDGPFAKFVEVRVDGKVVAPSNYIAKKGSTIITFLKSYLDTLDEGEHSVEIVFTNGVAETELYIVKNDEEETTEETSEETTEASSEETTEATTEETTEATSEATTEVTTEAPTTEETTEVTSEETIEITTEETTEETTEDNTDVSDDSKNNDNKKDDNSNNNGTNNNDSNNNGNNNSNNNVPKPADVKAPDSDNSGNTGVATGDTFELMTVLMLSVMSAAGMCALYYANKKNVKNRKR